MSYNIKTEGGRQIVAGNVDYSEIEEIKSELNKIKGGSSYSIGTPILSGNTWNGQQLYRQTFTIQRTSETTQIDIGVLMSKIVKIEGYAVGAANDFKIPLCYRDSSTYFTAYATGTKISTNSSQNIGVMYITVEYMQ